MDEKDPRTGRFQAGNRGGGRPKGARNKLGEAFLEELARDFNEHGPAAIVACREQRPTEYLKIVAGLLPKELLLRKDLGEDMSDEELADVLEVLKEFVAGGRGSTSQPTH